MKMVKSLLLGTAAGLVAMTGAQAADLPVKAKPVQYVKICSLVWCGFLLHPRHRYVHQDRRVRPHRDELQRGRLVQRCARQLGQTRARNDLVWRSRAVVTFDVRSQTEYGTLRSYMAGGYQWENGAGSGVSGTAAGAVNGNSLNIYRGFIQWAGFTAGRSKSFFDVFDTPVYSNTTNMLTSDTGGTGINLLGYTAQFGNGFSATISAGRRRSSSYQRWWCSHQPGRGYRRSAAVLRWRELAGCGCQPPHRSGLGQRADHGRIALHRGHQWCHACTHPDEIGWAVGAGLHLNLPFLGARDTFTAQVDLCRRCDALRRQRHRCWHDRCRGLAAAVPGCYQLCLRAGFDATLVGVGGNSLDLTTGWSIGAGYPALLDSDLEDLAVRLLRRDSSTAQPQVRAGVACGWCRKLRLVDVADRFPHRVESGHQPRSERRHSCTTTIDGATGGGGTDQQQGRLAAGHGSAPSATSIPDHLIRA